ncbi:MAG: acyl-CoA dehydrogenase family protein [Bacteroidota bacterium]|nr:acyl-CoA dehydrogenase family protein [Bacteroidota bacterium]
MEETKITTGGEFLVKDAQANDIFIPEDANEEQKMIVQTVKDFLEAEIYPNFDKIDAQEEGLMKSLLKKSGELGLLGISVPEEYEGFDQSFVTSMLTNEAIGSGFSFSVAFMAHTGIGTLPILYYGNEEQRQKYVPPLATGEKLAAYCLTEPGAGSDANSGRTKAVLSEDGKYYILNGQKMWITNGGFADVLTVFAKIDNDRILSAFIVDSDLEGITMNPEEKKMGIKGSSTRQIFFNDVKVPVENLLGKRGSGFRIALNILHIGRLKLGVNVVGFMKSNIEHAVIYSNERKQFGQLISNFGAIKYKLAEQVIKVFTTESAVYRASKDIENKIDEIVAKGEEKGIAIVEASAQFAVECALTKVLGSEALDYVVDESMQICGGMGFSSEMHVEKAYRDSRINRIFEGTNEINRMIIIDTAIKDSQKGKFDLLEKADEIIQNIDNVSEEKATEGYFEEKLFFIKNFKKATLMLITASYKFFKRKLSSEQQIMQNLSDMMIPLYASESTMLRVEKLEKMKGEKEISIYKDILDVFVYDSASIIRKAGADAINSMEGNEDNEKLTKALEIFTKLAPVNVKEARKRIADKIIDDNMYKF